MQMESLDPATHVYSFWEGVPLSGKQGFGQLFAKSKTLKVRHAAACVGVWSFTPAPQLSMQEEQSGSPVDESRCMHGNFI